MPNLFDSSGGAIGLGPQLGRGGEGTVYDVVSRHDLVAKIFHQPLPPERAEKIRTMARMGSPALTAMTAWPADILLADRRTPVGLLMPKATGFKDVHKLYSPKSRKQEFPTANFKFLVHAATNIARAFATVHSVGAVIGDVNHGGVTVAENATVKLIDCDSFQLSANGRSYLCEVGVPTFTPPELQGRPFRGVVRTPNHDNFGLAILIFHILFMGRHPFAGRFLGRGDMPIETSIQQFRFAYGADAVQKQMQPPPNVPALIMMTPEVATLFERAFGSHSANGALRPAATEWFEPLEALGKGLRTCAANQSHHFASGVTRCPWCEIENATGIALFNWLVLPTSQPNFFDIVTVWRTIEAIQLTSPPPTIPEESLPIPAPDPHAVKLRAAVTQHKLQYVVGLGVIGVAVGVLIANSPGGLVAWLIGGCVAGVRFSNWHADDKFSVFDRALREATTAHAQAKQRYADAQRAQAGAAGKFAAKRKQLQVQRDVWHAIPVKRAAALQKLEQERQRLQLERFLGNFFLEHATIPGIGPGRKATLESYGIETAADLETSKIIAVPGFGAAMSEKLLDWRRKIERDFRFDATKPIDPQLITLMDQELAKEKKKAEQALITGVTELHQIRRSVELQYAHLRQELEDATRSLVQARVDQRAAAA